MLSLAILTLNVTRKVAINLRSIEDDLTEALDYALKKVDHAVWSELSKDLVNNDGILENFTMEHQTYLTRPIAPFMKTSLIVKIENHLSVLDLIPLTLKAMF